MNIIVILVIITILGILNSLYLSWHTSRGKVVDCLMLPQEWCDKVLFSSYSRTLGVPNSYLGLGMMIILLILIILYSRGMIGLIPVKLLIVTGMVFSLYLLYLQVFVLRAFCTWCMVMPVIFTLLSVFIFQV